MTWDELMEQLQEVSKVYQETTAAMERYIEVLNSAPVRRLVYERKRGYRIPDFAWEVEEQQRRTLGSGNGRLLRD